MFSFFKKDPAKKLQLAYQAKLEQAMQAQRKGDMRLFAALTGEAEAIREQLTKIDS